MDTQTQIGIGAAAGIAIITILEPHMKTYLAVLAYLALGGIMIWGFWPIIRSIAIIGLPFGPYLSLRGVAANYYGKTRNTTMAEFAERSSNSPDEILNWYGYWMAIHGVRIFGKRPPSPNIDQVPQDDIGRSLHFKNGASELWEHYKTHPTFSDLSVKWGDLIKHRKVLLGRGSN